MVRGTHDIAVVKYCSGAIPFRPLCGLHSTRGSVLNLAHFKKGNWVYSGYPEFGGRAAVNLRTGEVVSTLPMPHGPGEGVDWAKVPFYAKNGFTRDESLRLNAARIAHDYPSLSTINESCVTYTLAFLLLAGLWLFVGLPLVLRRRAHSH